MCTIIDGRKLADDIQAELKQELLAIKQSVCLAVILIGQDPASMIYVEHKKTACRSVGIHSVSYDLPIHTSEPDLLALIDTLNQDPQIHGILVQVPLPPHINEARILSRISIVKDVDGFHPYNIGKLAQRHPALRPCTPYGIIQILKSIAFNFSESKAVIVGASNIVGMPMALELLIENTTVTVCHRFTKDLAHHVKQADLVIVAAGQPELIKGNWIKKGATVIDVGMNRLANGKIIGDVEFEAAKQNAAFITPVPGGVGPMTIAILLQNTLKAMRMAVDQPRSG